MLTGILCFQLVFLYVNWYTMFSTLVFLCYLVYYVFNSCVCMLTGILCFQLLFMFIFYVYVLDCNVSKFLCECASPSGLIRIIGLIDILLGYFHNDGCGGGGGGG